MFWKKKKREDDIGRTIEIPETQEPPVSIPFPGIEVELRIGNSQHIGKRKKQEDSFGFSEMEDSAYMASHGFCAVLSDGMGGLAEGRTVSEFAVMRSLQFFEQISYQKPVYEQMEQFIYKLNEEVCSTYSAKGKAQAGATLILVILYGDQMFWGAVGDSRIYLLRGKKLYQVNEDQDYRNQLLGEYINGELSLEEAFGDKQGSALASYIGCPSIRKIDRSIRGLFLQDGDKILLMSDGLYRGLTEEEIIKKCNAQPQKLCDRLVQEVLDKKYPSQDNITLLALEYGWKIVRDKEGTL